MGVKELWKLLSACEREIAPEELKGQVVAVDASVWIQQAVRGMRQSNMVRNGMPQEDAHIIVVFKRVVRLMECGAKLVFVFDGKAPAIKHRLLEARRRQRAVSFAHARAAAARLRAVLNQHDFQTQFSEADQPSESQLVDSSDSDCATSESMSSVDAALDTVDLKIVKDLPYAAQRKILRAVHSELDDDSRKRAHDILARPQTAATPAAFSSQQVVNFLQHSQLRMKATSLREAVGISYKQALVRNSDDGTRSDAPSLTGLDLNRLSRIRGEEGRYYYLGPAARPEPAAARGPADARKPQAADADLAAAIALSLASPGDPAVSPSAPPQPGADEELALAIAMSLPSTEAGQSDRQPQSLSSPRDAAKKDVLAGRCVDGEIEAAKAASMRAQEQRAPRSRSRSPESEQLGAAGGAGGRRARRKRVIRDSDGSSDEQPRAKSRAAAAGPPEAGDRPSGADGGFEAASIAGHPPSMRGDTRLPAGKNALDTHQTEHASQPTTNDTALSGRATPGPFVPMRGDTRLPAGKNALDTCQTEHASQPTTDVTALSGRETSAAPGSLVPMRGDTRLPAGETALDTRQQVHASSPPASKRPRTAGDREAPTAPPGKREARAAARGEGEAPAAAAGAGFPAPAAAASLFKWSYQHTGSRRAAGGAAASQAAREKLEADVASSLAAGRRQLEALVEQARSKPAAADPCGASPFEAGYSCADVPFGGFLPQPGPDPCSSMPMPRLPSDDGTLGHLADFAEPGRAAGPNHLETAAELETGCAAGSDDAGIPGASDMLAFGGFLPDLPEAGPSLPSGGGGDGALQATGSPNSLVAKASAHQRPLSFATEYNQNQLESAAEQRTRAKPEAEPHGIAGSPPGPDVFSASAFGGFLPLELSDAEPDTSRTPDMSTTPPAKAKPGNSRDEASRGLCAERPPSREEPAPKAGRQDSPKCQAATHAGVPALNLERLLPCRPESPAPSEDSSEWESVEGWPAPDAGRSTTMHASAPLDPAPGRGPVLPGSKPPFGQTGTAHPARLEPGATAEHPTTEPGAAAAETLPRTLAPPAGAPEEKLAPSASRSDAAAPRDGGGRSEPEAAENQPQTVPPAGDLEGRSTSDTEKVQQPPAEDREEVGGAQGTGQAKRLSAHDATQAESASQPEAAAFDRVTPSDTEKVSQPAVEEREEGSDAQGTGQAERLSADDSTQAQSASQPEAAAPASGGGRNPSGAGNEDRGDPSSPHGAGQAKRFSVDDAMQAQKDRLDALRKAGARQTDEMISELQYLLDLFGIPYLVAPGEADAQLGELSRRGLVDAVATEDSDVFLFGATRVIRGLLTRSHPRSQADGKPAPTGFKRDGQHAHRKRRATVEVTAERVQRILGFERRHLVALAMMVGSDYTEGFSRVGIATAQQLLVALNCEGGGPPRGDDEAYVAAAMQRLADFVDWDAARKARLRAEDERRKKDRQARAKAKTKQQQEQQKTQQTSQQRAEQKTHQQAAAQGAQGPPSKVSRAGDANAADAESSPEPEGSPLSPGDVLFAGDECLPHPDAGERIYPFFNPPTDSPGAAAARELTTAVSEHVMAALSGRKRGFTPADPHFPNPLVFRAYLSPPVDASDEEFSWGCPMWAQLTEYAVERVGMEPGEAEKAVTRLQFRTRFGSFPAVRRPVSSPREPGPGAVVVAAFIKTAQGRGTHADIAVLTQFLSSKPTLSGSGKPIEPSLRAILTAIKEYPQIPVPQRTGTLEDLPPMCEK